MNSKPICPICLEADHIKYFVDLPENKNLFKKKFSYFLCNSCAVSFIEPKLTKKDLNKIYKAEYFTPPKKLEGGKMLNLLLSFELSPYHDFVTRLIKKGETLLDVGCGRGDFLAKMQNLGWEVYGIEPYTQAVTISRQKVGEDKVIMGELTNVSLPIKKFDVITMWHVLEHLPDPLPYLRKINSLLLKKEGYLIMEVPNLDSVVFSIFGKNYNGLEFVEHVLYYSKNGLKDLLENNGFRVIKIFSPIKLSSNFAINLANMLKKQFGLDWKIVVLVFLIPSFIMTFLACTLGRGEVIRVVAKKQ